MARPLRMEYAGTIYHVMARGNTRQALFHGGDDYQRMLTGLEKSVLRTGWEVFSFVWMPNHIHVFFRTPKPNLSKGTQYLLSGYANWYAKRHQRTGHLFQGRFRGELIEDDSYFWAVSRYLHLNPVRGRRPLVGRPRDWQWSSYRGYCRKADRLERLAYDSVFHAWQGEMGGSHPERSYRRFVEAGIDDPPSNPLKAAWEGWVLGSEAFLKRIKRRIGIPRQPDQIPLARRLMSWDAEKVISAVAKYYQVDSATYAGRRSTATGRDLAAYLAHRRTTAMGTCRSGSKSALPQFSCPFPAIPAWRSRDLRIDGGERRRIYYDWDDINFSDIAIGNSTDALRNLVVDPALPTDAYYANKADLYPIENVHALPLAAPDIVSALAPNARRSMFWTLAMSGLAAPFLFGWLRRQQRELTSASDPPPGQGHTESPFHRFH